MKINELETFSVFVAIVGRANVGKSSLLNLYIGEKLAIVTDKPQTTRMKITGVLTKDELQYVFFDTPGIHTPKNRLSQKMSNISTKSITEVDVAVMLFEPNRNINEAETLLINEIKNKKIQSIAVINKVDTIKNENELDALKERILAFGVFSELLLISVKNEQNTELLLQKISDYKQSSVHFFSEDSYTDLTEKVIVEEIIREKLLLFLNEEIPHGTAVTCESFKLRENKNLYDLEINIYCEKKSHKGIIIGKNGEMLKKIGSAARSDIERMLDTPINLQLWVKVKEDWRDSEFLLSSFGYKGN